MDADKTVEGTFSDTEDTTAPTGAPVVSKVAAKPYQITIGWTASADAWLAGYEILRDSPTNATLTVRGRRGASATRQFTATGLLCNAPYRFRVDAFDGSGNGLTGANELLIRTAKCPPPPKLNTVMHVRPPKSTTGRTAYFHWGAKRLGKEVVRFKSQCRLDKQKVWKKCAPGKTYTRLKPGRHVFRVRAGDSAGWDPTPFVYTWTIRR
jgi:hypothetical protein